jgi:hypothetical protein
MSEPVMPKRTTVAQKIQKPLRNISLSRKVFDMEMVTPNFRAVSLFRIFLSLYLAIDFTVNVAPYFSELYGNEGILPISALQSDEEIWGHAYIFPVLDAIENIGLKGVFLLLYPVALLCFGIGYLTQYATIAVFVLNSYLIWRNPYLISGADKLAHLLLLWCLFLPLGRYYSIDALLDPKPKTQHYFATGFMVARGQLASLYVFSALFKLLGQPWRDGTALGLALGDSIFGGTIVGTSLTERFQVLLMIANYGILVFQLSFPFMVYCPWHNNLLRGIALALAGLMHLSFILCLNVGGFPYLCLAMLLLVVPDAWLHGLGRASRLWHERLSSFCDPVSKAAENIARGARNFLTFLALSLKSSFRVFDFAADNSYRFYGIAQGPSSKRKASIALSRLGQTVCGVLGALALFSNAESIWSAGHGPLSPRFDHILAAMQVRQEWSLFAPIPTHYLWNFRIVGKLDDGSELSYSHFVSGPIKIFEHEDRIEFASRRWLKYFTNLDQFGPATWSALGKYLCSRFKWAGSPHLLAVDSVDYVVTRTSIVSGYPNMIEHHEFPCKDGNWLHVEARTISLYLVHLS